MSENPIFLNTSENENGDHLEKSKLLSSQNNVIVLANGVKIHSTLNPNAKEFYPSYMKKKFPEYGKTEKSERKRNLEVTISKEIPAVSCANIVNVDNVLRELQNEDVLKTVTVERPKSVLKIIEIIESVNEKNNIKNAEGMASLLQPPINILEKMPVIAKDPKDLFFGRPIINNNNLLNTSNHSADLQKILDKEQTNGPELKSNSSKEIFTITSDMSEEVEDVGDHKCEGEEMQLNQLSKSQTALKPIMTKEILDGLAPPASPTNECCLKSTEKIVKNVTFEENPPKLYRSARTFSKIVKVASTTKNNTTTNNRRTITDRFTTDKRKESTTEFQSRTQRNRSTSSEANKTKPSNDLKSIALNVTNKNSTRTINSTSILKSKVNTESAKRQSTSKTVTSSNKVTTTLTKEKDNSLQARKSSSIYTGSKSLSVPSVSNSKTSTFNSKSTGISTSSKSKEAIVKATRSTLVANTRKKDT